MNKSLDIIKEIYKPYRYTLKGKVTILETTSNNLVVKEKENNIKEIYNYLLSRNFDNFPPLIDDSRNDINVFKYINDINNPKEQKAQDLIKLIANLHNKTTYFKDVTEDNYKIIYEDILNNINYLEEKYNDYYDIFYNELMMSPSHYLFMNNYTKIINNLKFCHNELDKWYELIKYNNKVRVSMIHNNLTIDHFLKDDKDYLISWDKAMIDSPTLDIIGFYRKEFFDLNFDNLISEYFKLYKLKEDEIKLLFIMISIPPLIEFDKDELTSCNNVSNVLDYIYKTEKLIRPYYSEDKVE